MEHGLYKFICICTYTKSTSGSPKQSHNLRVKIPQSQERYRYLYIAVFLKNRVFILTSILSCCHIPGTFQYYPGGLTWPSSAL